MDAGLLGETPSGIPLRGGLYARAAGASSRFEDFFSLLAAVRADAYQGAFSR
jgi:hypothetical protein